MTSMDVDQTDAGAEDDWEEDVCGSLSLWKWCECNQARAVGSAASCGSRTVQLFVFEHLETTAYHGHTHWQYIVLELDGIYDRQYFDNCAGKCKILVCLYLNSLEETPT